MTSCLVLFAHGSRDPRWRAPFERLAADLREEGDPGRVRLAYLEFVEPSLEEAVRAAVSGGARAIRVLPLFLASGAHVREDLPVEAARLRRAHPDVEIELAAPLGEDPRIWDAIREVARSEIDRQPERPE